MIQRIQASRLGRCYAYWVDYCAHYQGPESTKQILEQFTDRRESEKNQIIERFKDL